MARAPARLAQPVQPWTARTALAQVGQLDAQNRARSSCRQIQEAGSFLWRLLALSGGWRLPLAPGAPAPIHLPPPRPARKAQQGHDLPVPTGAVQAAGCVGRCVAPFAQVQEIANQALPTTTPLAWVQPARLAPQARPTHSLGGGRRQWGDSRSARPTRRQLPGLAEADQAYFSD